MHLIEKEFDFCGYHCLITFTEVGYRCGYVAIPDNDYFYEKTFYNINDTKKLPIPLSYAGRTFPQQDGNYWIGFTCDNKGDKPDTNRVKEIWGDKAMVLTFLNMQKLPVLPKDGTIRTTEYVEDKLKQLVLEIKRCNTETESRN